MVAGLCLYSLMRSGAAVDWRWPIRLILGSTMISMEWFNVVPLKEGACRILHARRQPALPGPCNKLTALDGG